MHFSVFSWLLLKQCFLLDRLFLFPFLAINLFVLALSEEVPEAVDGLLELKHPLIKVHLVVFD